MNRSEVIRDVLTLFRSIVSLSLIQLLTLALIVPPKYAVSASTHNEIFQHQPHINLLLLSGTIEGGNGEGGLLVNNDRNSPVFAYFLSEKGLVEYIGQRNSDGEIENVIGTRVTTDDGEILFELISDTQVNVTVNYMDFGPVSFDIDQPVTRYSAKSLGLFNKMQCYDDPSIYNPSDTAPSSVEVVGEIEAKECGENLNDSDKSKYNILFDTSYDYKSKQFFNNNQVSLRTSPDRWSYSFVHPPNEWPFYDDWFSNCYQLELVEGAVIEITETVLLSLLVSLGPAAIAAAYLARYGRVLSQPIIREFLRDIKTIYEGVDLGREVVEAIEPCEIMKREGKLKCLENGTYAQDEKEFWQRIIFFKLKVQSKRNATREAISTPKPYLLNRDTSLPKHQVDIPVPENGTAIPAGTYSGTGEWRGPGVLQGQCTPGFNVIIDQDGNLIRFEAEECFTGNMGGISYFHPYIWEMTPNFGPLEENHRLTVTSYDIVQADINGAISSTDCYSQYQASIAPSGNPGTEINITYDKDSGMITFTLQDFAYRFNGPAAQ